MLLSLLSTWEGSPFAKVIALRGKYGITNLNLRRLVIRRNASLIREIVRKQKIGRVYIGTDCGAEAQAALHFAKESNSNSTGIYFEDGTAAYSGAQHPVRSIWKKAMGKMFYGSWWEDVSVHGTSKWIDEARLIYPDLARTELAEKVIVKIEPRIMLRLREEHWPVKYLSNLGIDLEMLNVIDGLVLLPRSTLLGGASRLISIVNRLADYAESKSLRIGIKCHPRDIGQQLFTQVNGDSVFFIPGSIPVELLYIYGLRQLRFIVAGVSTSLLTARWLLDIPKVISITEFSGSPDARILKAFQSLSIEVATSFVELDSLINDHI
jgi:hypothetical protein